MKRLFLIEFHKLKHNKAAKALSLVYFLLFSGIALFASIRFNFGNVDFRLADQGIFNFPYIWHFTTYIVSFLKLFLAVVIVSMVSSEYTHRTLKQNLIDGLSKKEFILSKFYGVLGFALASTFLVFIVSFILGLIFSDYDEVGIIFSDLEYIFAYFLKLICFFSLCLFFGVLLKRSAFALGFLFLLWISEALIQLFVKFQAGALEGIIQFLPLQAMGNLIVEPFTRLGIVKSTATQLNSEFNKSYDVEWSAVLIVSVWCFIFMYSSWKLLQKRDL